MRFVWLTLGILAGCASPASDDGGAPVTTPAVESDEEATLPAVPAAGTDGSGSSASSGSSDGSGEGAAPPAKSKAPDVTFKVLTYNVAGLPEGISKSHPLVNTPQISPKLNPYDLVVVQEDFSYHDALVASATHPYLSTPSKGSADLGDGLNALSRFPFSGFSRTKWASCNGYYDSANDCLTPKGFTRFVVDLGGGRQVDVYDVHFDAGQSDDDSLARSAQIDQIVLAIGAQSTGRAVIVAGDTNMKPKDEALVLRLLKDAGLADACRTLGCAETARIDRVMFRSSPSVVLAPRTYAVESWLDPQGEPLSDHEPVSVEFSASSP